MPTPILIEGFEHGVLDTHQQANAGTGICDTIAGAAVIDSATPIIGAYSLTLTFDKGANVGVEKTLPSLPSVLVGKFRFRTTAALPEATTSIFWLGTVAAVPAKVRVRASDGAIGVVIGTGTTVYSSVVVTDGAVHSVGFRLNVSGTTWTLEWEVDALPQATFSLGGQVASTVSAFRWGTVNSGDGSTAGWVCTYDSTMLSATSGDYPLPNFTIKAYSPNADGTHNAGTNVIEADGGADIDGTTTPAWPLLDEVPLPAGIPTNDWVQQSQVDAARYAEVLFADEILSGGTVQVLAVSALVAYTSSAGGTNNGTTRIVLADGTTVADVYSGPMGATQMQFKHTLLAPPAGGWDGTKLNGLRARVGFASDVAPVPRWCALLLQAAWRTDVLGTAVLSGTGGFAATASGDLVSSATLAGAGAAAGTAVREVFGTAALTGLGDLHELHNLMEEHIQFNAHIPFGDGGRAAAEITGTAALSGFGGAAAVALAQSQGRADLAGLGGALVAGVAERLGAADLDGAGVLEGGAGPRTTFSGATLAGAGVLEASSDVTAVIARFLAAGALVATAEHLERVGAAVLAALGDLVATADVWDRPTGDAPFVERAPAWERVPMSPQRAPQPPTREVAWSVLDAAGRAEYLRALLYSHPTWIRVDVLDGDEGPVASLTAPSSVLYDGALQVDTTADVPRRLTLSVSDVDHSLLDMAAGGASGSLSPASLLQATRLDYVPWLGQWVAVPLFTGSVTSYSRQGADASLEAMGKEYLYLGAEQNWRSVSVRQGARIVDAMRIIAEARGERRFRLPEIATRLTAPVTVPQGAAAWPVLQRLADHLGRQVYFDAEGLLSVRVAPISPSWVFDQPGGVDTEPQVSFDVTAIRNTVHVLGKAPARGARPGYIATPAHEHPLSPWSLARAGVPRYIAERVETQNTRNADCQRIAENRLGAYLIAGTQASFEALALPPVEPNDVATLTTPGLSLDFRLTSYTMPLLGTGVMQVGEVHHIPTRAKRRSATPGRRL